MKWNLQEKVVYKWVVQHYPGFLAYDVRECHKRIKEEVQALADARRERDGDACKLICVEDVMKIIDARFGF